MKVSVLYFLCFCLLFFLMLSTVTIYLSTKRVCKGSGQVLPVELINMQVAKYHRKDMFINWFERYKATHDFFYLKTIESANHHIEYVSE